MENLRHWTRDQLISLMKEWGQPRFRAEQIYDWVWKKHLGSIEEMTNLPLSLRQRLEEQFFIPKVSIDHIQVSEDGTIKNRLKLADGHFVESVLIPTPSRVTLCVSSQVGCSLACAFCATGFLARQRNLHYDEIFDEVTLGNEQSMEHFGRKITNIVFMGMGEPLLNYRNLLQSIEKITDPELLGMSPRRITVSTAGIAKMIHQLGNDGVRFKLALSVHAARDDKRNRIMSINETSSLNDLVLALEDFYRKTRNEITLEYILFRNFNDSLDDAEDLVRLYRRVPVDLVNIIEYNPVDGVAFQQPEAAVSDAFVAYLQEKGVNTRIRRSRGKDIDAACGQLANINASSSPQTGS